MIERCGSKGGSSSMGSTARSGRVSWEFRDVVFEDVVVDNNSSVGKI